jgi:hypothetical protein
MSGLRRKCENDWAETKRGSYLPQEITISSAAGWMLERAYDSGRDPLDEVAEVAEGDSAGSDFWDRVRTMLRAIGNERPLRVVKS